jgi:hypothetical protein
MMCGLGAVIGGIFGFGVGMVLASIVDIAGLAYEDDPAASKPQFALAPQVDPKRGTAGLSLVGSW